MSRLPLQLYLLCAAGAMLLRSDMRGVRGVVKDAARAAVANASVEVRSAGGTLLAVRLTDADGRFEWLEARPMPVQIRVAGDGFAHSEKPVAPAEWAGLVELTLEPASVYARVTVNATRGGAEEAAESPHAAAILLPADVFKRPAATLGNALEQAPGILVQQSTYTQVSPFLRGLTGYHVLNLMDGIRFNNSTFRSGPNQYLAYVEPMQAQRVESLLGPTG